MISYLAFQTQGLQGRQRASTYSSADIAQLRRFVHHRPASAAMAKALARARDHATGSRAEGEWNARAPDKVVQLLRAPIATMADLALHAKVLPPRQLVTQSSSMALKELPAGTLPWTKSSARLTSPAVSALPLWIGPSRPGLLESPVLGSSCKRERMELCLERLRETRSLCDSSH